MSVDAHAESLSETQSGDATGSDLPESSASTRDPLPPRSPERYEILGEHARGGLGRILLARDLEMGRTVAVKELLDERGRGEARFVREAMITAFLDHPGIVPVYEVGRWPSGKPYYAMKLVSGQRLKDRIAETETIEERLALVSQVLGVADAIAYAHSRDIIHRDIKPSNVVVGEYGETIVVDWGLAKHVDSEDPTFDSETPSPEATRDITLQGAVVGTAAYMAPEQAAGKHVDKRADVYALGSLLYHTLCGGAPYAASSSREIVSRLLAGPPDEISTLR